MEKNNRISNRKPNNFEVASKIGSIEAMRESASTIDGIFAGIYSALHDRKDIDRNILDLLMLGAARAEILTEDLSSMRRFLEVRSN